jgi:hypothetical protein
MNGFVGRGSERRGREEKQRKRLKYGGPQGATERIRDPAVGVGSVMIRELAVQIPCLSPWLFVAVRVERNKAWIRN